MKFTKYIVTAALLTGLAGGTLSARAADNKPNEKEAKPKPYPLDKCTVSGEKLGSMGKPYVFTHEGREIKLCCKGCLDDFKKDSAKLVKQLEEAEKKPKN